MALNYSYAWTIEILYSVLPNRLLKAALYKTRFKFSNDHKHNEQTSQVQRNCDTKYKDVSLLIE